MNVSQLSDVTGHSDAYSSGHETLLFESFESNQSLNTDERPFTQSNPILLNTTDEDTSKNNSLGGMNDPPVTILNEKFNEIATNATIFTLKSVTEKSVEVEIEPVPDSASIDQDPSDSVRRTYKKKKWTLESISFHLEDDEWKKIVDPSDQSFIKKVSTDLLSSKLATFKPQCKFIAFNKYTGKSTWTMLFKCKNCTQEYKLQARTEKLFKLYANGTAKSLNCF